MKTTDDLQRGLTEDDAWDEQEFFDRWRERQPDRGTTRETIRGRTPPQFSSEWTEQYNATSAMLTDAYRVTKSEIKGRINTVAYEWYNKNGQVWPSATQLLQYSNMQRAMEVYASGAYQLPPFFQVGADLWVNHGLYGPEPVGPSHPAFADSAAAQGLGGVLGAGGTQYLRPGDTGLTLGQQRGQGMDARLGSLAGSQNLFANVPFVPDLATLNEILVGLRPGGGGRGRGSGGRADLVFDEAQLQNRARAEWRELMLEEPDDVEGLVNKFLREANSFWRKQGGQLDFTTFIFEEAKKTGRYKNLYRKKPEFQSEAEYRAGFQSTAAGFGLSPGETLRQVESGMGSGASLTGFSRRVQRGRENEINQQGSFSQRFANGISQLGGIGRS